MRTSRTIAAATVTAVLALGGGLSAAPVAQAAAAGPATLVHDGGELWYKAAAGQDNRLTVSARVEERGEYDVYVVLTFDDRVEMSIDPRAAEWDECVYPSAKDRTVVRCAVEAPLGSDDSPLYNVTVRDGADTVTVPAGSASADATIYGGPGKDVLTDNGHSAVLYGEDGDDRLRGGGGGWGMGPFGGKGDDTISECAYVCRGGAGDDFLTGDGESNGMYGDSGDDVIEGRQGRDSLYGGVGDDTLRGGRGADKLYGEQGNDTLWGDQDNDELWGNSGNDVLYGGAGADKLSGGPGRNKVRQ
ncbi:calcium-binding protein [Streptomyces sp. DSM 3412]|uniref:Calcium-binding protein n=1 Tax=Streptomyces gottesmaniae TaxID=3075518 RepID=A0ABU2ZDA0_9ACTN|nr:calcium-binding protein [Streptomyces sp. DSM 3412]MDT0574191.1 calcium-binding protein [Streptomyces sp. DSM 3412]